MAMDPFWHGPVRMIQPNLRMTDARGLDGRDLVRQCRDYGANSILANGGGIVAWYPTDLEFHWRNPYLKRDFVGEVTGEARKLGMRVLLRMDWSCLIPKIGRKHRDWLALDADGKPVVEWPKSSSPLLGTCPNRPYWREFAFQELAEIMGRYPVDGFFFNAWNVPYCHCPECRRACRDELGFALPRRVDWDSEAGRKLLLWRERRHADFTRSLRDRINGFGTRTILTVDYHLANDNPHHLGRAAWDGSLLTEAVDMVTVEAFNFLSRQRPHWKYWAAEEAQMIRSFPQGKPGIVLLSGSERWFGRRPAQPPEQVERDLNQIVAHGAHPCVAFSGDFRQEDPRLLPVVKRFYRRLESEGLPPAASVHAPAALVYAQRTMDIYGGSDCRDRALAHYRGWYEALTERGINFTVLHDGVLGIVLAQRRRLRTLILPNCACLSDADCAAIDGWVRHGGRLITTFETSRFDERGRKRKGFGLKSVGRLPGKLASMPGSWFDVDRAGRRWADPKSRIFPVGGEFLFTKGTGRGALRLLDWVYNNKPEWSQPDSDTGQFGIYERRWGRGRALYIPWTPGKLYHLSRSPLHGDLLARLVRR